MALGRRVVDSSRNRDINADYKEALIREHESYRVAGLDDRAKAVADVLRDLGHDVRPKPKTETLERAVDPAPVERAVEKDEPAKRPVGRPLKNAMKDAKDSKESDSK
jgi:hypothetical protein